MILTAYMSISKMKGVSKLGTVGMAYPIIKLSILCVLAVTACTPRTLIVRQMTDIVETGISAFEHDDDLELLEKAIPSHIKLVEAMLANSPGDPRLLTLLARLYGSYAFGFVETRFEAAIYRSPHSDSGSEAIDSLKDQVNRTYEKGFGYALLALEKNSPGATDAFNTVATIAPYLDKLRQEEVASLFWYGFNLGAWVNHNRDSIRAVSKAHIARKVMDRVIALDSAYNHGGAHLFLMTYFGSRPPMLGGSEAKALTHYQALKRIAGNDFLLADLFYGRYTLQQQQDREAFIETMQRIIDHPSRDDQMAMVNAIAARRATIYLSAVDSLFQPQ